LIKVHTILSKNNGADTYYQILDTSSNVLTEQEARLLLRKSFTGYGFSVDNGRKNRLCTIGVRLSANPRLKLFQNGKVDKLSLNYDNGGNYLL
jgi:hypothetical protein